MNKKSIEQDALLSAPQNPLIAYKHLILAGMLLLLSYLSVHLIHPFHMETIDTILLFLYIMISYGYANMHYPMHTKHYKLLSFMLLCLIPNIAFDNYLLKTINALFILMLLAYFLQDVSHKQITHAHQNYMLIDIFQALILHPIFGFQKAMTTIMNEFHTQLHPKHLGSILIGILLSIPLMLIILPLLISADTSFSDFIYETFCHLDRILIELCYFVFSLPIFAYLYPLLYAHIDCERQDVMIIEKEKLDATIKMAARVPASILVTMEIVLCTTYALFLFLTCKELLTTQQMTLASFSYSQFARQGFFELCAIAIINIFVISLVQTFTKNKESSFFYGIKYVLCIETILIIFTAMTKMTLYIYAYGLTPLRVYSSWFMFVLLGIFLLIIIHTRYHRNLLLPHIVKYFCICFLILNLLNMNSFITMYNKNMPIIEQTQTYLH